jgi:hypothetical protein
VACEFNHHSEGIAAFREKFHRLAPFWGWLYHTYHTFLDISIAEVGIKKAYDFLQRLVGQASAWYFQTKPDR